MPKIIAIANQKGGVGKTTLTINLGTALATRFNKRVIIIDGNVTTSHIGLYLGMYYSPVTLNQVLRGEAKIENAIYDHYSGVKIIPASLSLKELEKVDITKLETSVRKLFGATDFILIDTAPGLGKETISALKASEEVIFVTTPFIPPVMDIIRTNLIAKELDLKVLGIVLNMVRGEKYELKAEEVEQLTEVPVISSIPLDKNVLKSLASKMPVVVYNPKCKASKEIFKLAAKVLNVSEEEKGILTKLLEFLRLR